MGMSMSISQNGDHIQLEKVSDVNLESGQLMRVKNFTSKFIQPRDVDIWLPESYSEEKEYDVLYMHL